MGKLVPTVGLNFQPGVPSLETQPIAISASAPVAGVENRRAGALILGGAHGSPGHCPQPWPPRGSMCWFATHDHPLAKYSRYVKRGLIWPGPNDPQAVDWLLALAARSKLDGWVLFPAADAELRLLSQNFNTLSKAFHVAAPPWSTVQWAHDKRLTQQHAQKVGIATPLSIYPDGIDCVARWQGTFPVVIKPTVHDKPNAFTRAKAWRADNLSELIARYSEAESLMGPNSIVIQEMIAGGGEAQFSYAGVWNNGEPLAGLVARRTRQFPARFRLYQHLRGDGYSPRNRARGREIPASAELFRSRRNRIQTRPPRRLRQAAGRQRPGMGVGGNRRSRGAGFSLSGVSSRPWRSRFTGARRPRRGLDSRRAQLRRQPSGDG